MVWSQILIDWLHLLALAMAIGLLVHELGLIALGHGGLLLAGAYATGFMMTGRAGIAVAIVGVVAFSLLMAAAILRVRADIFALVTLAFGQIIQRIAIGAIDWTGGSLGFGPLPRSDWLAKDRGAIVIAVLLVIILAAAYWLVVRSRLGLFLGGSRDNELATRMQGVHTRRLSYVVLTISGLAASAVGGVQAVSFGLITPRMGIIDVMLQMLAAAMLARPLWRSGRPSFVLVGYAIGAAVLILLPPLLRRALPDRISIDIARQAILGLMLYLLMLPRTTSRFNVAD